MILRDYQCDLRDRVAGAVASLSRRAVLQMGTGGGKTVVACDLIRRALAKGKRVLFLAHMRQLVLQCSAKLTRCGIPHGVIMAGVKPAPGLPVQVASKDTLFSRAVRREVIDLPPADLVIPDECHLALAGGFQSILQAYPSAVIVGLTATPVPQLGAFFGALVCAVPKRRLIELGWLAPPRMFCPHVPDLKGVRTVSGDYVPGQLEEAMNRLELVGDIVGHWQELAGNRRTVGFFSGIAHSRAVCGQFQKAGIAAAHVDGHMEQEEVDGILERFRAGRLRVLCNAAKLPVGWDCPMVGAVIFGRPTKSYVLYAQQAGRGMRPWDGAEDLPAGCEREPAKTDCLFLDHAGNILRHGLPDDEPEWSLDQSKTVEQRVAEKMDAGQMAVPVVCKECHAVYSGRPSCPACGARAKVKRPAPKAKVRADAKLRELLRDGAAGPAGEAAAYEARQRAWRKALYVARSRGGKVRMALAVYRGETGRWPDDSFTPPPPRGSCCDMPAAEYLAAQRAGHEQPA